MIKKFSKVYGNWRLINSLRSPRHWSLSWIIRIQATFSHPTTLNSIEILTIYLHLGFTSWISLSGVPIQILCACFSPHNMWYMLTNSILLHLITAVTVDGGFKLWSSWCHFLQHRVTSNLLGQNTGCCIQNSHILSDIRTQSMNGRKMELHEIQEQLKKCYLTHK